MTDPPSLSDCLALQRTRLAMLGLGLTTCAESVPSPVPSLGGKWEQLTVHTVYKDRTIKQLDDDQWEKNEPGSIWVEFAANGTVQLVHNGVATPTNTTYTYQAGSLTFRSLPLGETVHPVLELSVHHLVYRTHTEGSTGTEDVTFTYQR